MNKGTTLSCMSCIEIKSRTKIDLWLNGQALFDPVFKWYLNELKINLPNKSYSLDNRLRNEKSSHFIESLAPRCRLIFSKIDTVIIGGTAHPITR